MRRSVTDRILERLDVRAFYSQFTKLSNPSLKGECRGICPLHEEKTASFWVNVHDGSFKCFGCGQGGGPVQFYAAMKNVSEFDASAELLRLYGENGNGRPSTRSRKAAPKRPKAAPPADALPPASAVTQVNGRGEQASPAEIYQAFLEYGRPLARESVEYFDRPGIRVETLDRFRIAFLSDTREVERRLLEAFGQEALVRAGVFKEKDGRTWLTFSRHPILFPILKDGLPVWMQGRVLSKLGKPSTGILRTLPCRRFSTSMA